MRQGFTVQELLWEDGRVVGIRGRDATGATVEERAAIVIGADGARSFVARAVGAPTYNEVPATTVNVYSYFRGLDLDGVELYVRPGRFFVATPTNDGLTFVNQTVPAHEADRYRGRMADAFAETIAEVPHLAEPASRRPSGSSASGGRRPATAFFRMPSGPGWALVGDAGYHLDPITAQGMLDAFRDAELPRRRRRPRASAATSAPSCSATSGDRDTAAMPMYEHTANLADVEPPPPPEMVALLAAPGRQPGARSPASSA